MRAAVLITVCLTAVCLAADDKKDEEAFVALFNGKDLTGWKQLASTKDNWAVEDGLLVCKGDGGGWLGSEREYADFILRLDYRLKPGGNSGVYIRAPETGHISRVGMEIQILDDNAPQYAKLDFYQYTGSIYGVVPPMRRAGKPAGEWNSMEIRALGRQVVVLHNGKKIVDADLDWHLKDPAMAKEHPGLKRTSGRIGLQSHTDRVEFRNVQLRDVKAEK